MHDFMYILQLHMRVPQDPAHQVMTPDAFQARVSWPEVRPFYQGEAVVVGVGNEEAGNENEEEDEEDEEGSKGEEKKEDSEE